MIPTVFTKLLRGGNMNENDKRLVIEIPRSAGRASLMALLSWTSKPIDKSSPDPQDDEIRCSVLNKIAKATAFAINDKYTVFRVEDGRVLATRELHEGCPLVWFDFLEDGKKERVKFWFNESSVKAALELATSKKEQEGQFATILLSTH